MIDFNALVDDLSEDDASGPTVGDVERSRVQAELMTKVLEALAKPPSPVTAPSVNVNVPEQAPPQVIVQAAERKVVSWTFEFERNVDGTIKRIHASPKE